MGRTTSIAFIAAFASAVGAALAVGLPRDKEPGEWAPRAAAAYLDQRADWWMSHMGAMDHGTYCISCHTAFPYAIARSALRGDLAEQGLSPAERRLLDGVTKRVRMWNEVQPVLGDNLHGRGTESVLDALTLISYDAHAHQASDDTRLAFKTMWAQQLKTGDRAGAWPWFGDGGGGNEPWEGASSQYWGATQAALAVGLLPPEYRSAPEIRDNIRLLKEYLQRGEREQPPLNRLSLLWASEKLPGLLTAEQQKSVVSEILLKQHSDGGWSASELLPSYKRSDGTPQETKSDGYATGLAAFVLRQSSAAQAKSAVTAARKWLATNQDRVTGSWIGYSLNRQRDPASDVGKFMTEAATAYAVLGLAGGK